MAIAAAKIRNTLKKREYFEYAPSVGCQAEGLIRHGSHAQLSGPRALPGTWQ